VIDDGQQQGPRDGVAAAVATATQDDARRRANEALWRRTDLVQAYATRTLRPVEVMLLVRYRESLSGRVLELGCGAGRLTGYLAELASTAHGIDISPAMVEHCRRAYPRAAFSERDLRDLSMFEAGSFDAIVASYNVIDVLDDEHRRGVLDGLHRLLVPDGLLIFSTHNRDYAAPRRATAVAWSQPTADGDHARVDAALAAQPPPSAAA